MYVNQSSGSTATNTYTGAHTCTTDPNRAMFFSVMSGGNAMTSLAYGGDAATKISETSYGGQYRSDWLLINPKTGTNNIVAIRGGTTGTMFVAAALYKGAKQTGQPDATDGSVANSGTTLSTSLTTVADNCWLIMGFTTDNGGTMTSSDGVVRTSSQYVGIIDSNGAKSPAGTYALSCTNSGGGWMDGKIISLAPVVVESANTTNFFQFF